MLHLIKKIVETDGEQIVCEFSLANENVVILHGAGTANRKRYYPFAEKITELGYGVILFDFSGHGESSGELKELSLARRQAQAQAVIDNLVTNNEPLYLIGFSMGAQTVCDLLPALSNRVKGVLLGCPGLYSVDIHETQFKNELFSKTIREHESWLQSTAYTNLQQFTGKTLVAIGSDDEVIPEGVTLAIKSAAPRSAYIEYKGVGHQLAVWLGENRAELNKLLHQLLI